MKRIPPLHGSSLLSSRGKQTCCGEAASVDASRSNGFLCFGRLTLVVVVHACHQLALIQRLEAMPARSPPMVVLDLDSL